MKAYRFNRYRKLPAAAVWLLIGFTSQAPASDLTAEADSPLANWKAASDAELAESRGGFTLPNGMIIDVSLEKTIYLNGKESFSSVFQLPSNVALSQSGLQNLSQILTDSGLHSVIQNNLDNQIINAITEINITLRNLPSNISTLVPGLPNTISLIAN
jgi:hypothetical protein